MRTLWRLVLSVFGVMAVQASPVAEQVIKTQTELLLDRLQVDSTVREDPRALEILVMDTIGQHVDFSLFSQLVLGKHRKRIAPDVQARFERALTGVVVKTYVASLASASQLEVSYLGVNKGKKKRRVTVLTLVKSVGNPAVKLDYRLYEKDGRWRVYDVVIEGVSMMMNYRRVVSEKIKAGGIEAVIDGFDTSGRKLAFKD